MSKSDLGRFNIRGATNARIWITESGAPVRPGINDLWLPTDYPHYQYKRKSSTTFHSSNTTMTADADITFSLPENGIFEIVMNGAVSGATGADIKTDWKLTGGVAQLTTKECRGPSTSAVDATNCTMVSSRHNLTTDVPYGCNGSNTSAISEKFLVETSGGAGTITLRHAQNVSNPVASTISTNTWALCTQIGGTITPMMRYTDSGWVSVL